MGAVSDTWPLF